MTHHTARPRHELLRDKLATFGFTRDDVPYSAPVEEWTLDTLRVIVPVDPNHSEYDAYCDRAEHALTPLDRAFTLGRETEAVDAMERVWRLQEQYDANEAVAHPASRTRLMLDLLEDAAHAAGGPHALTGLAAGRPDPTGNRDAACGCVRCTDENAAARRAAGAPFSSTLGSLSVMCVCPTCGNKRCPKATWHGNPCTGSNDPGQPGSRFEHQQP